MKVGIYNSSLDNREVANISAGILAEALAARHQVEIVQHLQLASRDHLEVICQRSLAKVSWRSVNEPPQTQTNPDQPDRRYQALRNWSDDLTRSYDLFINFSDRIPIFNSAQRGVLAIQFPHDFVPSPYRSFWYEHLGSYQLKIANSYYTSFWTKIFWDLECPVVHPPVPITTLPAAKKNVIVANAPFRDTSNHLEMIAAFKRLKLQAPEWSLSIIGGLDQRQANRKYFDRVQSECATNAGVSISANPSYHDQSELFKQAKIIWQPSATGIDFDLNPDKADPFNLDLLRAMEAGCVPLVNNSGGLSEVIRHQESGFFWDTSDELVKLTLTLTSNFSRRAELANASRARALEFRPEKYVASFMHQLEDSFGLEPASTANADRLWKRLLKSTSQLLRPRNRES